MHGFVLKPAIDSGRRTPIGPRQAVEAAEAPKAKASGDLVKFACSQFAQRSGSVITLIVHIPHGSSPPTS
jgi:hypothetical protein